VTALHKACRYGRGEIVKALLESGADPTIANNEGTTPMASAKQGIGPLNDAESRECVALLEVSLFPPPSLVPAPALLISL
jgi:hypothetical protein